MYSVVPATVFGVRVEGATCEDVFSSVSCDLDVPDAAAMSDEVERRRERCVSLRVIVTAIAVSVYIAVQSGLRSYWTEF